MSSNNKTSFQCGGVYPHKVKYPAESKVYNKCKNVGHSQNATKQN